MHDTRERGEFQGVSERGQVPGSGFKELASVRNTDFFTVIGKRVSGQIQGDG